MENFNLELEYDGMYDYMIKKVQVLKNNPISNLNVFGVGTPLVTNSDKFHQIVNFEQSIKLK